MDDAQREKMATGKGFIAALDQSGGSTPKALQLYGIEESDYSGDAQMFDLIHEMRSRIITSPAFDGDRVLGAILFEDTMRRQVDGKPTVRYLWEDKHVVPFVKVDEGLSEESDGVQLMKPMTKLDQQFEVGRRILDAGLVPILEPEVDIHAPDKARAEELLKAGILARLGGVPADRQVMLKLSIPSRDGFYGELMAHPRVLRVVALSGGYSRKEADELLARNPGLIASFSRALTEGLTRQQSQEQFDAALDEAVSSIYAASTA